MSYDETDNGLITRLFHDKAGGDTGGTAGGTGGVGSNTGEGGTAPVALTGEAFRNSLPEDIRGHTALAKIDSLDVMANSFVASQKFIGKDPARLVEIPETMDDTFRGDMFKRMGLPDTVEGYKLVAPEGASPTYNPDTPMSKAFVEAAHKNGILPGQAQGMFSWFSGFLTEAEKASSTTAVVQHATNVETLKGEFGEAYDAKLRAVMFAVDKLGGADLKAALDDADLGTSPPVIRALAKIGEMLAGDTSIGSGENGSGNFGGAMTPAEATQKANELTKQAMDSPANSVTERRRLGEEATKFRDIARKRVA